MLGAGMIFWHVNSRLVLVPTLVSVQQTREDFVQLALYIQSTSFLEHATNFLTCCEIAQCSHN